jgi:hypothetical protein
MIDALDAENPKPADVRLRRNRAYAPPPHPRRTQPHLTPFPCCIAYLLPAPGVA